MRAAIEAGGTKFVCAVGTGPGELLATAVVPTTTPDETLDRVVEFFRQQASQLGAFDAMGIASFGPIDIRHGSPTYGRITTTPKSGWQGTDIVGRMRREFDVPVGFDTDVNGAALAEHRWGATRDVDPSVYITVGTGIGGGALVGGRTIGGMLHPEMGHVPMQRRPDDDFAGVCPFHGDCVEGMASGPAIHARYGLPGDRLGELHETAVEVEAWYLAQLVAGVTLILSPRRIVIGGGVARMAGLLDAVRRQTIARLNGSLDVPEITERIDDYLVSPGLGGQAGVLGAVALANRALDESTRGSR